MKEKYLNLVCYFISILFVIYVLLYMIFAQVSINKTEQKFIELNSWMASVNKKAEEENLIYKKDNETTEVDPIFTDGKTALISAYNSTMDADSLVISVLGQIDLTFPYGLNGSIKVYNKIEQYNKAKRLEISTRYLLSASDFLRPFALPFTQNGYKMIVEKGSKLVAQMSDPSKATLVDGVPTVDFTGISYEKIEEIPSVKDSLYVIDENTIDKITYFKIKYKNSVPYQYFVQAQINNTDKTYSNYLLYNMPEGAVMKSFSTTLTVIIDSNGNLSAISSRDDFSFTALGFSCNAVNTQSYAISCVNEDIKEHI